MAPQPRASQSPEERPHAIQLTYQVGAQQSPEELPSQASPPTAKQKDHEPKKTNGCSHLGMGVTQQMLTDTYVSLYLLTCALE